MPLHVALSTLATWTGGDLDAHYVALVGDLGGKFCSPYVRVYRLDEIIERNETFETKAYCPGYLAIGDDSGGRAIVIELGKGPGSVYIVDQGSMSQDDFVEVAPSVKAWAANGYRTGSDV